MKKNKIVVLFLLMGIVSQKLQSQNMFGLLSRSAGEASGAIVETDSAGNLLANIYFLK